MEAQSQPRTSSKNSLSKYHHTNYKSPLSTTDTIEAAKHDYALRVYAHTQKQLRNVKFNKISIPSLNPVITKIPPKTTRIGSYRNINNVYPASIASQNSSQKNETSNEISRKSVIDNKSRLYVIGNDNDELNDLEEKDPKRRWWQFFITCAGSR
ncbi:hypothetical protein G9A89_009269 [Geosiphon pyriformis]|nr:hypothetical protein G9A89_009269 [Geosiphon pyriformis]